MNRFIAAALLALCACGAQAQTSIRVFHVFTLSAYNWLVANSSTPDAYINTQITTANNAMAASGTNFQFTSPQDPYAYRTKDTGNNYAPFAVALDLATAATRDQSQSDIVVVVSNPGFPSPLDDSLNSGPSVFVNTPLVTVEVNVQAPANQYQWLHEVLDHVMGAGHQKRLPTDPGTNHGYVIKYGTTVANCVVELDVTTSRVNLDTSLIVPNCNGWTEYWPPGTPKPFVCDAGVWCTDWSVHEASGTPPPYPPATPATTWGVSDGTGNQTECGAYDSHYAPPTYGPFTGTQMYAPQPGINGEILCPNITTLNKVSGQNVFDGGGIHLGNSGSDNVTWLNSVSGAFAALHNTKRAPVASIFNACLAGIGPCPLFR